MAFKDLLVQIDPSNESDAALEATVILGRDFGAHVIGLHAASPDFMPAYSAVEPRGTMLKLAQRQFEEQAAAAKDRFERQLAGTGLSMEWRAVRGAPDAHLTLQARYADLVLITQPDETRRARVDHLLIGAGRPVLLVPRFGSYSEIGTRVLVAWDESREATRAVNDAIPFLAKAQSVTVLSVTSRRSDARGGPPATSRDLSHHLARHGITVESSFDVAGYLDVADILLSRAADLSADLIVMGAYGHARLREIIMGGVTRSILEHMTTPVLMSH